MAQADPEAERPTWIRFYDSAELAGLTAGAHLRLGRAHEAEAETHRALALLRPAYRRNRMLYTVQLAHAQLAQGDVEQAVATASTVGDVAVGSRTHGLLGDFDRDLLTRAPDARHTRMWLSRARDHEEGPTWS